MAITTSSSMSVKPRRGVALENVSMAALLSLGENGLREDGLSIRPDGLQDHPPLASLTVRHLFPARHVPDLDRVIAASRHQSLAVGEERQGTDEAPMAAQCVPRLPGCRVPDSYRGVLAGGGEPAAIGAEGHGTDVPGVSTKGLPFPTGLHVPDLGGVPFTTRHQPPAVRAERHVQKRPGNPGLAFKLRLLHLPEAGRIPRPHLDLPAAAGRSQVRAVAAEHHRSDLPVMGAERADLLAGPRVPDLHGSVLISRDQGFAIPPA